MNHNCVGRDNYYGTIIYVNISQVLTRRVLYVLEFFRTLDDVPHRMLVQWSILDETKT